MKKLIGVFILTALLPAIFLAGCNGSKSATAPAVVPTATSTTATTPAHTPTATHTGTITPLMTATAQATQTPVNLGTAAPFAVLAFSDATNTGTTTLCGNLGLWSGTSAGAGYVYCNGGVAHITDGTAQTAQGDLTTAIGIASGAVNPALISGDLGGLTLYQGLYKSTGTLGITGDVTLDAQGNTNAVFVFQIASSLTTAVGSEVILANGAKATNVFWQVTSNCALGNYSIFKGTIMSGTATTVGLGVALEGRALAKSEVTMQADSITVPAP